MGVQHAEAEFGQQTAQSPVVQVYRPAPVNLIQLASGTWPSVGPLTLVAPFRVPTPDSRLSTTVTVLFRQDIALPLAWTPLSSLPFDATRGGDLGWSLWLAGREFDVGGTGAPIPRMISPP